MKTSIRLITCIAVIALAAGCSSLDERPKQQGWSQSEILGIVAAHPDVRHDFLVRGVKADGPNLIVVGLADDLARAKMSQQVILERQKDGSWKVTKVTNDERSERPY